MIDTPVLDSVNDYNPSNNNDDDELSSTGEVKDNISPSEMVFKQHNENESTPVVNEYDLFNSEIDLRYIKY